KFLDTTVTKFLASNDTAVTKYLAANDVSVTKFLEAAIASLLLDDAAVAQFLDTSVTKFLDSSVTKFLDSSVTKFLDTSEDGIAVTKYLSGAPSYNTYPGSSEGKRDNVNMTIIQFLEENDISVTKFLQ
ncbi:MAG: hypothetical protein GY849_19155, partial [Deltaproteobacteria bacterium]|nr:hypothetical protein [Deltaproteobacteria bacterium]